MIRSRVHRRPRCPAWVPVVLCLLLLLPAPSTALATIFFVNSTADGPVDPDEFPDQCTLRKAVQSIVVGGSLPGCGSIAGSFNFDAAIDLKGVTGTITLTEGPIEITGKSIWFMGPGADQLSISGNSSSRIFIIGSNAPARIEGLTLRNGRVNTNSTQTGGAGILSFSDLAIVRSVIESNTVSGEFGRAGGIWIREGGTRHLDLIESTVSGNRVLNGDGGGIVIVRGTATIINSTISGNSAAGTSRIGGGLVVGNLPPEEEIRIVHSTIAFNSAPFGGNQIVVLTQGAGLRTVHIENSIIATEDGRSIPQACLFSGSIPFENRSGSHNIVTDDTCVNPDTLVSGGPMAASDIRLDGLANNGGSTLTHALRSNSPALHAAVSFACTDVNFGAGSIDQRGVNRPQNSLGTNTAACDVGAFERTAASNTDDQPPANTDDPQTGSQGGEGSGSSGSLDPWLLMLMMVVLLLFAVRRRRHGG